MQVCLTFLEQRIKLNPEDCTSEHIVTALSKTYPDLYTEFENLEKDKALGILANLLIDAESEIKRPHTRLDEPPHPIFSD